MNIKVVNKGKSVLEPFYEDDISKKLDSSVILENYMKMVKPITDNSKINIDGNWIRPMDFAEMIVANEFDEMANLNNLYEDALHGVFEKSLQDYNRKLKPTQVFITQANSVIKAPIPSSQVIYVPDDFKQGCKDYLQDGNVESLIVNTYFYLNEPYSVMYFKDDKSFKDYLRYIGKYIMNYTNLLSVESYAKFQDFSKLKIDMLGGIALRNSIETGREEYSFERLLMKASIDYSSHNSNCGFIVPNLGEFMIPTRLLYMNVSDICKAPASKLVKEIGTMKKILSEKYMILPVSCISKLVSSESKLDRIKMKIKNHSDLIQDMADAKKRDIFKFSMHGMTQQKLADLITRIIKHEVNVSSSENYFKTISTSYMRCSRRDPDNPNIPGKRFKMSYKPDIHIYLDTSGSISEDNYKNAILTCIQMARKLKVNLYFTSFSDCISDSVKLNIKGKSNKGMYKEFQRIPKVGGGTNYEVVWAYIMKSQKRQKEISLMITDFAYYPPQKKPDYPSKLYYAPIDISTNYWEKIRSDASDFCKAMYHIDPVIRQHILMS